MTSDWIDGEFLQGRIPLAWLGRACRLGSLKALATALAIWFQAGLRKRKHELKLTTKTLKRFGVDNRAAKSRALEDLERAGLIAVERQPGKNPVVTILNVEPEGK